MQPTLPDTDSAHPVASAPPFLAAPIQAQPMLTQPEGSTHPEPAIALPSALVQQLLGLVQEHQRAQRSAKRWKYGFRGLLLAVFCFAVLWPLLHNSDDTLTTAQHIGLIKLEGTIELGSPAGAEPIMASMQAAFEDPNSVAIVLQMNSPGGSPVQAAMIYEEINRLRLLHKKPVYAVVEELCASACYYVAAAVDDIYVSPASLVGSIGVLMDGFGAPELIKKLGIERRLNTAGDNKAMLDPFLPTTPGQQAIIKQMLGDVHQQFISAVKEGRGDALKPDPEVFSGRIYTGNQSIANGLADALGSVNTLARDVVKVDNLVDYSPKENIAERVAKRLGASFGAGAMQSLLKANPAQTAPAAGFK